MSKFSFFFFGNPTNKTVTGTAHTWELLIANHLDHSLWLANKKYWVAMRSNLLHSFLEVHNCVAPFTSGGKLHEFGAEKPISWAKPAHFDFFTINFTALTAFPAVVNMWPWKNISSQPSVVNCFSFPTPPIKLKLGLQIGGRLLIANHLDQSLYCRL